MALIFLTYREKKIFIVYKKYRVIGGVFFGLCGMATF